MHNEVYRNTTQYVYLDIYGGTADTTPVAEYRLPDGETRGPLVVNGPDTTSVPGAERWTATIGLAQTQNIGELAVEWSFTMDGVEAGKTDFLDVVVPLVDPSDLRAEVQTLGPVTEDELIRAERKVRSYIENFTGQVFAPTNKALTVRTDSNRFLLPERLISVSSTTPDLLDGYELLSDGFAIKLLSPIGYDYPGVISAPGYYDVKHDVPYTYSTRYRTARELTITGRWGWERVPRPVQEAALLLVEDFLSPDGAYRDKYLESLTSPDWRIQFNSGAFAGTGNVRVDQLLADYVVKSKWEIV